MTSELEPIQTAPIAPYCRAFEEFWTLYPRHVAKGSAYKAWRAACKRAAAEEIKQGLIRLLPLLKQKEERFVPHASTWLNGDRWLDEDGHKQRVNGFSHAKQEHEDTLKFFQSRVAAYKRLLESDPEKAKRFFQQQHPRVREAISNAHEAI